MKRNKWILQAIMLLTLSFIVVACGSGDGENADGSGGAQSDEAKTVTFRLAHVGSESHQYQIAAVKLKEIVEERTDGRVQIQIFNNGVLGNEGEVVEQVIDGTIDIGAVVADSSFANTVPEMNVFGLPYLFRDLDHVYETLDGEIGQELLDLVDEKGMKALGFWEIGFRHLTNDRREVRTPEDMNGLSIRVQPSAVWNAHMSALGANPTPIAFNELYSAMDQGVVDGQENPLNTIYSMKFYEVQQYVTLSNHNYSPAAVVMSNNAWNSMTAEEQQIFAEAFEEAKLYQRERLAEIDAQILNDLKEQGVTITEPDIEAFREATKNVKDVLSDQVPMELIERIENVQ